MSSRPKKPLWLDGLFLEPNHLQQQDRYHERLVAERLSALVPYEWGVLECVIDERAVTAGELRVTRLDAVLPDGTLLRVGDGGDDSLPARTIEGFRGQVSSLDVFVGVAQESDVTPNVDLVGDPSTHARLLRTESSVSDFNTGKDERAVPWGRHNVRLLFGDERRDRFDAIRIAQLVRASSGAVVLRTTMVPPALRIGASPFLPGGFQRVLSAMTAKQQALSASRRQRSAAMIDFQAADAAKFWLLHTLNQKMPVIAEIADKPHTHPREAHLALAELVGALCTFDVEASPASIPKYDHLAIGDVFERLFAMALSLLDRLIAERFVQIPLERHDGGFHIGQLRDPAVFRHAFFLGVAGSYTPAQFLEHVPRLTKVASARQIGSLVNSAVNGAILTPEHHPPGALPLKPGLLFFRLDTANDCWNDVVSTGTIALYQPFDPTTVQLSLFAVDPETLQ